MRMTRTEVPVGHCYPHIELIIACRGVILSQAVIVLIHVVNAAETDTVVKVASIVALNSDAEVVRRCW